jgi:hypothetical protein
MAEPGFSVLKERRWRSMIVNLEKKERDLLVTELEETTIP